MLGNRQGGVAARDGTALGQSFHNVKDALFLSVNEFQGNDLKLIVRANIRLGKKRSYIASSPPGNSKTLAQIMADKCDKKFMIFMSVILRIRATVTGRRVDVDCLV